MTAPQRAVFLSYDEPDCLNFAQMIGESLTRSGAVGVQVRMIPVPEGECHRDHIAQAMADFSHVSAKDVIVVSAMKDNNTEEYRKVKELCLSFGHMALTRYVLTCIKSLTDPSLLARNVLKGILSKFST
eukprot:PhF_6_TR13272/c0_g1_i1/m.21036